MSEDDAAALTRYLHDCIPLTAAMEITAVSADHRSIRLSAPLAPNRNHEGGVFGGSIATLALATCWALARARVRDRTPEPTLLVADQHVHYLEPARGPFEAVCEGPGEAAWSAFTDSLARRGRARVELQAAVESVGVTVARFRGRFVALAR